MRLKTRANLPRSDDVYAALLAAHEGLSPAQSEAFHARLILILANHIGDADTLFEAIAMARGADSTPDTDPTKR